MNSEIGRELGASELKPRTVVVLSKQDRPAITAWVAEVGSQLVTFYMGDIRSTLICRREGEQLFDDTPARITPYEYLGEV